MSCGGLKGWHIAAGHRSGQTCNNLRLIGNGRLVGNGPRSTLKVCCVSSDSDGLSGGCICFSLPDGGLKIGHCYLIILLLCCLEWLGAEIMSRAALPSNCYYYWLTLRTPVRMSPNSKFFFSSL